MVSAQGIRELKDIVGKNRCLTAPEDLMVYSHDVFAERRPDVVILPMTTEEVSRVLQVASREKIPVTPRGSATGLSGMCTPEWGGIVMAMSKMNKILEISPEDRLAIVEPGVITQDLQEAVERAGVFYPPDPASQSICQIGGNVATNAGGPRCVKYGVTRDYILGLEAVLASGEVIKTGGRPIKNVTGYDITRLICGSEGTLAVITKIIIKLIPKPEARRTLLVAFRSIDDASVTVSKIMAAGILPRALELMDHQYIRITEKNFKLGLPVEAAAMLIIEVDGFAETVDRQARIAKEFCERQGAFDIKLAESEAEADRLWVARKTGSVALFRLSKMMLTEDATVPISKIPSMVRKINEIREKYRIPIYLLAHAGDGNMHPLITYDPQNKEESERVDNAVKEIFETSIALGGTLSGEHGIGLAKKNFLHLEVTPAELQVWKNIKKSFDPEGILNPGKFV
ncbi:MAG: FAD-binding protein [Deltaproteobacteria bacterium]|nr:FAD-binding protein [Deltaproteobacteria bacterium]